MITRLRLLAAFAALAGFGSAVFGADEPLKEPAVAPAKPGVALPLTPRFNQVRSRIDALFRHRNDPPVPPSPRGNPFRTPGTPIATPAADPAKPEPAPEPTSDLITLEKGAATLKISGIFEIAGKSHLVINARPYKEGDVVPVQLGGETLYLRVRSIARRSVTLTLNNAETTLKF